MVDIPEDVVGDFTGFFLFEPYNPSPNTPRSCYSSCSCGGTPTDCDCDLETVCGGSFLADLSTKDTINFSWEASSNDDKYISIKGSERTRVEFIAEYDCDVSPGVVEIRGSDIEYSIHSIEGIGLVASSNSYVYNAEKSFVILGKCDGCSECEIFTRLQFDPKDGVLDLNLKSLKYGVEYDSSSVIQGEFDYKWSTLTYCWMRGNTYNLLDLSTDSPGTTSPTSSPVKEEETSSASDISNVVAVIIPIALFLCWTHL